MAKHQHQELIKLEIHDLIIHISILSQASSTYGLRFVSNNTSKRSQKDCQKDSHRNSQRNPHKHSHKDSHKNSHKDSHKDSQTDNQKDSQKDNQKDTQKDSPNKHQEEISSPAPCNSQFGGGHCFTVSYDFHSKTLH